VHEVHRLQKENERLARECLRQQALVRLARQADGLSEPGGPEEATTKPRRKRQTHRGQQAAFARQQKLKRSPFHDGSIPSARRPRERKGSCAPGRREHPSEFLGLVILLSVDRPGRRPPR
jgi:hypothetical protein